jgi:acetyl/propionyl-CoA carboxylase alpha subunit
MWTTGFLFNPRNKFLLNVIFIRTVLFPDNGEQTFQTGTLQIIVLIWCKRIAFFTMRRAISIGRLACRAKYFHNSSFVAKPVVEKVPALGESITEGTIASWAKKEGDKIEVDDVIVIVETDKVTVDIKSTHAGVLTKRIAVDTVRAVVHKVRICSL